MQSLRLHARRFLVATLIFAAFVHLSRNSDIEATAVVQQGRTAAMVVSEKTTSTTSLSDKTSSRGNEEQTPACVVPKQNHCVFVVTLLYGNHTVERRNATLEWYVRATVASVQRAQAQVVLATETSSLSYNLRLAHIAVMAFARQTYDTDSARDFIHQTHQAAAAAQNFTTSTSVEFILQGFTYHVRKQVQTHQCQVVSVLRLPGTDVITSQGLVNLHSGWNKATLQYPSPPSQQQEHSNVPPVVMVTGSQKLSTVNLFLMDQDDQSSSSSLCAYIPTKELPWFWSATGLTVTMPVPTWMQHFGGNSHSLTHFLAEEAVASITQTVRPYNISVYKHNVNFDQDDNHQHAIHIKTMLDDTFRSILSPPSSARAISGCGKEFLTQHLGEQTGQQLFQLQDFVPNLSAQERAAHAMVINSKAPGPIWNGTLDLPDITNETLPHIPDIFTEQQGNDNATATFHHCVIAVTGLWGNHSEGRRNVTLTWYAHAAVNSVRDAKAYVEQRGQQGHNQNNMVVKHVGVSLIVRDSYDTPEARDFLRKHVFENEQAGLDLILENHTMEMRRRVEENQCNLVSLARTDADDMFEYGAFEHLNQGWNEAASVEKGHCTKDNNCSLVMVTGTQYIKMLYLWPMSRKMDNRTSDEQFSGPCSYVRMQQLRNYDFLSPGLSVTMPTWIWMQHFSGDSESAISHHHRHLYPGLKKAMWPRGIYVYENVVMNHALYTRTMLSSYFGFEEDTAREAGVSCGLHYLTDRLGKDSGKLVWNARAYIPDLTKDEWSQNVYLGPLQHADIAFAKQSHPVKPSDLRNLSQ